MKEDGRQLTFIHGRMAVHGQNAINSDTSRIRAAETTAILNDPHNLEAIVTNPDRTVFHEVTAGGVHISVLRPTGPYSNRALMTGMYDKELKEKGETHWVYDYLTEEQRRYWEIVLAGLHAGREILEEEGRAGVSNIYVENSTHVSDITQRTSRTIRFPHGHFIEIDPDVIHPTTSVLDHVEEEQAILRREELVRRFGARVLNNMRSEADFNDIALEVREGAPFGYQFSLDGQFTPGNVNALAKVLAAHHKAFTSVSDRTINAGKNAARLFELDERFGDLLRPLVPGDDPEQMRVLKTPSYRLYLALNEGMLDVIVSPEFWSHGGVLEAMNINLDRDPNHAPFPIDQRLDFEARFRDKITAMIGDPNASLGQETAL